MDSDELVPLVGLLVLELRTQGEGYWTCTKLGTKNPPENMLMRGDHFEPSFIILLDCKISTRLRKKGIHKNTIPRVTNYQM